MDIKSHIEKFYCNILDDQYCITHPRGYGFCKVTLINEIPHYTYFDGKCEIKNCEKLTHEEVKKRCECFFNFAGCDCEMEDTYKVCGCQFDDSDCDCDMMNGDGRNA